MHKDISFTDLIQGTLKSLYELVRKFSNKSYGVAEKERNIFYYNLGKTMEAALLP